MAPTTLSNKTRQTIKNAFNDLNFAELGSIYCEKGGDQFWKNRRKVCERQGTKIGKALLRILPPKGKSVYVGAGVAEIPPLLVETLELHRTAYPFNLRKNEVSILNQALGDAGLTFQYGSVEIQRTPVDHLWMVSVLNDPESFPFLSALSYGRADPLSFDPGSFVQERDTVLRLTDHCMKLLTKPGWVTTSIEEVPWVTSWCEIHEIPYHIEEQTYPTALVEDPICFIQVG